MTDFRHRQVDVGGASVHVVDLPGIGRSTGHATDGSKRQLDYFAYFTDILTTDTAKITPQARAIYADAYSSDSALTAGFSWYRTLAEDARANATLSGQPVGTPVLYLRGENEGGRMADYLDGFRTAGLTQGTSGLVAGVGHFTQEEAPLETWRLIAEFAGL